MRRYKLHYGSRFFPSPYKVTFVLCPDGRQRTCLVWCWEGDHSHAEVQIRGEKIQGTLNLTKKFYNALLYPESMPNLALFYPSQKENFWKIVGGKPFCACGAKLGRRTVSAFDKMHWA